MSNKGTRLTFTGHLIELRDRLVKCVIALLVTTVIVFIVEQCQDGFGGKEGVPPQDGRRGNFRNITQGNFVFQVFKAFLQQGKLFRIVFFPAPVVMLQPLDALFRNHEIGQNQFLVHGG